MLTKSERTRSSKSCWTILSIIAFLTITPMATGSSANAASFSFTQIDVPGVFSSTQALGINDAGQIVGHFNDGTFTHGFLATPTAEPVPEPSTFTLLSVGIGLAVLCVMRHREEPIIP